MKQLRARVDQLESAMGRKGPTDLRFEDILAAIYVVMREQTDRDLDHGLVAYVRELLEQDRHLWEKLPLLERKPGWADRLKSDDGALGT